MLYLMQEEGFVQFPWCQRTLRGLWDEVRRKRISLTVIDRIEQIPQEDRQAGVLLLGASGEWIERQADRAMAQGAHPILLTNRMQEPQHGSYSAVMMDIGDSMRAGGAVSGRSWAAGTWRSTAAIPTASSDPWREKVFLALTGQDGEVFHNRNSLRSAFDQFWPRRESFDGVICASDYRRLFAGAASAGAGSPAAGAARDHRLRQYAARPAVRPVDHLDLGRL